MVCSAGHAPNEGWISTGGTSTQVCDVKRTDACPFRGSGSGSGLRSVSMHPSYLCLHNWMLGFVDF